MKKITFILLLLLLSITKLWSQETNSQAYIERYKLMAIHEMLIYKIPASITMAQAILESSNGESKLAKKANNHFGIKCHLDWKGKTFIKDDDKKDECFRVYEHAEESYRDHSIFLAKAGRYASLFKLEPHDFVSWAKGLRETGYATDTAYPTKITSLINRYELFDLDEVNEELYLQLLEKAKKSYLRSESKDTAFFNTYYLIKISEIPNNTNNLSVSTNKKHEIKLRNNVKYIITEKDDNVEGLAKEFGLFPKMLYKYNDLKTGTNLNQNQLIYLQPKRNKAIEKSHTVKESDTYWSISQQYGIKLSKLLILNGITENTALATGQELNLRKKKK